MPQESFGGVMMKIKPGANGYKTMKMDLWVWGAIDRRHIRCCAL